MTSRERDSAAPKKKPRGCYLVTAFVSFFIIGLVQTFWPGTIPFKFGEFWRWQGTLGEALRSSWPIFAFGVGLNAWIVLRKRNDPALNRHAELILGGGFLVSLWAGVVEEISFRWIIFFGQIAVYKLLNWLFFGCVGFGLFEWVNVHLSAPVANFFTFGALASVLSGSYGWAVSAALLTSNGKFRDGHLYQGFRGWLISWFLGMFFFYLMFKYGLPAAILVHFLYDMFIFVVAYVDAAIERKQDQRNLVSVVTGADMRIRRRSHE